LAKRQSTHLRLKTPTQRFDGMHEKISQNANINWVNRRWPMSSGGSGAPAGRCKSRFLAVGVVEIGTKPGADCSE
jgi:hypothetical protein